MGEAGLRASLASRWAWRLLRPARDTATAFISSTRSDTKGWDGSRCSSRARSSRTHTRAARSTRTCVAIGSAIGPRSNFSKRLLWHTRHSPCATSIAQSFAVGYLFSIVRQPWQQHTENTNPTRDMACCTCGCRTHEKTSLTCQRATDKHSLSITRRGPHTVPEGSGMNRESSDRVLSHPATRGDQQP